MEGATRRLGALPNFSSSGFGDSFDFWASSLPELYGVDLVRDMWIMAETDETVGAMLYCITSTMRQIKWEYVPQIDGVDTPEDEEAKRWADLATTMLKDMDQPFDEHVEGAMTMLWAGFAPMEMVFKRRDGVNSRFDDGYYGIGAINLIAQTSVWDWVYDKASGKPTHLKQIGLGLGGAGDGLVPLSKTLLYRTSTQYNNPRGRPLLKNAWRSWRLKRKIQDSEALGIERELCGLPIFEMPEEIIRLQDEVDVDGNSTEDAVWARKMVRGAQASVQDMRLNKTGGLVLPSDTYGEEYQDGGSVKKYNFRIQTTGGQRSVDSRTAARDYDHAIARTAMMQFLTLGQRSGGSYALSDDQSSMAVASIMALADKITAEWNSKAVPLKWLVNAFPAKYRPRLKHSDVNKNGIVQLGQFLAGMAKAESFWGNDPKMRRGLAAVANLPYDNGALESAAATFQQAKELVADPPEPTPAAPTAPAADDEED